MNGPQAYGTLVRPKLAELLDLLHLDVVFERASGCYLWPRGSAEPVLDLVGGYGSLLLGHNHPELVKAAIDYLQNQRPIHAQGSIKPLTGELAARLGRGKHHVLLANSGSEAVEAALKHVMVESRGPIVALEGGFHGKTLGALQLTANPAFRKGFQTGLAVIHVAPNDTAGLREVFRRWRPAALFLELIQGEGGVVPLTPEFVALARRLCAPAALVIDECQTGLGRTGKLTACEHYGVEPDLLILSKALGGGIAKIAAVLIRSERYRPELGLIHTSTFADDDFSSAVALRVLDLLTEPALAACAETGRRLKSQLNDLATEYPEVIREVRGLGLMLGVELAAPHSGLLLPLLGSDLGYIVAGYLYHRHRIRIAPTLSNPLTLRIQPSLPTPREELDRFVTALGDVCARIRKSDTLGLTRYFLPASSRKSDNIRPGHFAYCKIRPTLLARVGWLFHLNTANDLLSVEPDFALLSDDQREEYLRHVERRIVPIVVSSTDVTSGLGRRIRFDAILLPLTARRIRQLLDAGATRWLRRLVQQGIDVAQDLGCGLVSLGQYTSIVMRNGTAARPGPIGLTTGNSYTVALALKAIEEAAPDLKSFRVAVVGATGNIGSAVATLLAQRCRQVILIGRDAPASVARLTRLKIPGARISTSPIDCRGAQVVVVATSSPSPVVRTQHLRPGTLVCDLSVPAGVDCADRTDIELLRGGIVRLPHGEDFHIPGFRLAKGLAYACMAEGIVLAQDNSSERYFTGAVTPEHVHRIAALAKRHGFDAIGRHEQRNPEVIHVSA